MNKTPSHIKLHRSEGSLSLHFGGGEDGQIGETNEEQFTLSGEYLRVYSPSAEVRGHGPGEEILQHGKKNVKITKIEAMGHYALRIEFDDGHDSGIFAWEYLYDLCSNYDEHWQDYLDRLSKAGQHRDVNVQVVQLLNPQQD